MNDPAPRNTPGLADLAALVVGYGLAALLARSLWPSRGEVGGPAIALIAVEYLWLGLAMSGPLVLLLGGRGGWRSGRPRRPGHRIGAELLPGPSDDDTSASIDRYSRSELAWMTIGGYWIALLFLVGPAGLGGRVLPVLTCLVVPTLALSWAFGQGPTPGTRRGSTWTHRAAVVVLWTWPLAWITLIVLGVLID